MFMEYETFKFERIYNSWFNPYSKNHKKIIQQFYAQSKNDLKLKINILKK